MTNMTARRPLQIVLILCIITSPSDGCLILQDGSSTCCLCGSVNSSEQYLFVNDTISLNCILYKNLSKHVNSSMLFFKRGSEVIDSQYIITPDDSTITYLYSALADNLGDNIFHCFLRKETGTVLVNSTIISIEYPPAKVRDFHCVLYNWDERLDCEWTLPYPYSDINNINVTLLARYGGKCRYMNTEKTNCSWMPDQINFSQDKLEFKLTISNAYKAQPVYSYIRLVTTDLVKPAPVYDITFVGDGSRCVNIRWQFSKEFSFSKPRNFRIQYKPLYDDMKNLKEIILRNPSLLMEKICGLNGFTRYSFTIDVHSSGGGHWSEPVTSVYLTDEDVPGSPPQTVPGGYTQYVVGCTTEQNKQEIVIYIKQIPEKLQHSIIRGYKVNITDLDSGKMILSQDFNNGSISSLPLQLPCDRRMAAHIRSFSSKGLSRNTSTLNIHTVDKLQDWRPYDVVIEYFRANQTYNLNVSWKLPREIQNTSISYISIFYCLQGKVYCKGQLYKKSVPYNVTSVNIPVDMLDDFQFGISVIHNNVGSGLQFTRCVYTQSAGNYLQTGLDCTDSVQ